MPYSYSAKAASGQPRPERQPSAWPVYVMCVLMGFFGLDALAWVWFVPWIAHTPLEALPQPVSPGVEAFHAFCVGLAPYSFLFGVFGVSMLVAAVGAWLFRPWGWWCTVSWIAAQFLLSAGVRLYLYLHPFPHTSQPTPVYVTLLSVVVSLAFYVFVPWTLVSRRRLFFRQT